MSVWKIDVFANETDQGIACCTYLVRGNTEADATQLALDEAKALEIHSDSPRVVPRGFASDEEAQRMPVEETVRLIMYGHPKVLR